MLNLGVQGFGLLASVQKHRLVEAQQPAEIVVYRFIGNDFADDARTTEVQRRGSLGHAWHRGLHWLQSRLWIANLPRALLVRGFLTQESTSRANSHDQWQPLWPQALPDPTPTPSNETTHALIELSEQCRQKHVALLVVVGEGSESLAMLRFCREHEIDCVQFVAEQDHFLEEGHLNRRGNLALAKSVAGCLQPGEEGASRRLEAALTAARLFEAEGNVPGAQAQLQWACEQWPTSAAPDLERAALAYRQADVTAAFSAARAAAGREPESVLPKLAECKIELHRSNLPAARRLTADLLQRAADLADVQLLRAELAARAGDTVELERAAGDALAAAPGDGNLRRAVIELAEAYRLQNVVLSSLAAVLDARPKDAHLLFDLGVLELKQGRARQARIYLERALQVDSQMTHARAVLGSACYQLGDFESAAQHLRTVVNQQPDDARLRLLLAESLKQLGRINEARQHVDRVLESNPHHAEAKALRQTLS